MSTHIVQAEKWGEVKTKMGTPAVRVGNIQYTKHKIPFSQYFYAYCPKVDPFAIEWEPLQKSLEENGCIAINFDVPNVEKGSQDEKAALKIFEEKCRLAVRTTFAQANVVLDLTQPEEKLLENMHKKHRYNIGYAQRQGVTVEKATTQEDFEIFYSLLAETAQRQKYYIHSKEYYQTVWEILEQEICHILIAKHKGAPLVAWMLFTYDGVLYYPYGGSSEKLKNLQGSNLITWEAIKLGKGAGCKVFDLWGAAEDPNDTNDPWHGFTNFKLKFGGKHVTYINSYDLVVNESMYTLFNTANELRWKVLNFIK